MSVCGSATCSGMSLTSFSEFLALRKIPLRKQSYILAENHVDEGESSTAEAKPYVIDPAALKLQRTIQDIVLEDRDIADKVRPQLSLSTLVLTLDFRPPKHSCPPFVPIRNTKQPTSSVFVTSMSSAWAQASGF
jgi:hypothetical protein